MKVTIGLCFPVIVGSVITMEFVGWSVLSFVTDVCCDISGKAEVRFA